MKPTAADIAVVTGKIEARDWLDPSQEPIRGRASSMTRRASA